MRLVASIAILAGLLLCGGCRTAPASHQEGFPVRGTLFEYPYFREQATGIAVSAEGRIFVNFPRWDRAPTFSVAELTEDGSLMPFPDATWNSWKNGADPASGFVCVQSVYVDDDDFLWILDPASPAFSGVVAGGPKLVKVDLETDAVVQVIRFTSDVAPPQSYLNDVRIDPQGRYAYLSDSGTGAIIVVDLVSGTSVRRLAGDPTTKAEAGYVPIVAGKELRDHAGKVPQIHVDGIALDSGGEFLYYHALVGRSLYRIRTAYLRDASFPEAELETRVEKIAETGAVDGMVMDDNDDLYLTSLENNAVVRRRHDGTLAVVASDPRMIWPDSMSLSADNYLYVTASQINLLPRFNNGIDRRQLPYRLFKVWLEPL